MAEVVIHCLPAPGTDPAQTAAELEAYLLETEGVTPVLVEVEHPRAGLAEILTIVEVVSGVVDLIGKLADFIKSRQEKAGEQGTVRDIEVEIDGDRVPVASLTADQRARLLVAIAEGTV
jgi:hypothetical protein